MTTNRTMTNAIKALCKAAGVKNSVSRYGSGSVYVKFLSEPTQALCDAIQALSTCEAHGDIMDDTRWYSGTAIHFRYDFPVTEAHREAFEAVRKSWADHGYHFERDVVARMGPAGRRYLDSVSWRA